jgi:hypothetical protein
MNRASPTYGGVRAKGLFVSVVRAMIGTIITSEGEDRNDQ